MDEPNKENMNSKVVPSAPAKDCSEPTAPPPSYDEAIGVVHTEQIQVNTNNLLDLGQIQTRDELEQEEQKRKEPLSATAPPVITQPLPQQLSQNVYSFPPPVQQQAPSRAADDCCLCCFWYDGTDLVDCCYCLSCCSRHLTGHDCVCCDCGNDCCSCPDGCCECGDCDCGECDCGDCDCGDCDCGDCNCDCGDCVIL